MLLNQKVKISADRTIISYFAVIHYLTLILVMFIGNYQQKREASDGTWYLFVCVCFWTVTMGRINSKNIQWKCKRLLHAQSLSMYMYMYIQTFLDGICLTVVKELIARLKYLNKIHTHLSYLEVIKYYIMYFHHSFSSISPGNSNNVWWRSAAIFELTLWDTTIPQ